ncbi:ABC transporter permease [Cohnella algarum]|uniref:ABC transporter permease n=1 Tax=Cohnella algarum TaxID=2044859 RepID=UPI001967F240|nr:ABC-2 family transporter protein [Cohnella algarum]MBN2983976.1 ABC-2 family transporter protein [Cohnella algarum]
MGASLIRNFPLYRMIVRYAFHQRFVYRSQAWLIMLNGFAVAILQGSLWTALIQAGTVDITLREMMSYVIINSVVGYFTYFEASSIIGNRIRDGSIIVDFTMPVEFKWKLFAESIGENLFDILFYGTVTILTTFLLYGAAAPASALHFLLFVPSIVMGILISYHIIYILSLSAFWIVSPYYIGFLIAGLTKLFGGGVVPLWFYPDWLAVLCDWLPFRYITFEPIEIYLGLDASEAVKTMAMQVAWMAILLAIEKIVWKRAAEKVFVQGG